MRNYEESITCRAGVVVEMNLQHYFVDLNPIARSREAGSRRLSKYRYDRYATTTKTTTTTMTVPDYAALRDVSTGRNRRGNFGLGKFHPGVVIH